MQVDSDKNKIFAKGFCFTKIFIFFLVGCFFGSCFEEIVHFFQFGKWTHREDLIYGPFSSLYGFGVVLFLLVMVPGNHKRGILKTFFYCFLIGGIAEYFAGLFLDEVLKIKFWDYSNMAFNIHGRTTIPIMLIWGFFGTVLVRFVYPGLSKWIERIPYKIGSICFYMVFIFMAFNIFLSYSAFLRMLERNKGVPPKTRIGSFYDSVYTNEFMYKRFPILKGE